MVTVSQQVTVERPEILGELLQDVAMGQEAWHQLLVMAVEVKKERRESKAHHKAKKHAQIRIDRVEIVTINPEQLPDDAQFKGYDDAIVQDMVFRTENVTFRKEK